MTKESKSSLVKWIGAITLTISLMFSGLGLASSWGSNSTKICHNETEIVGLKEEDKKQRDVDKEQGENVAKILAILEAIQNDVAEIKDDVKDGK